MEYRQLGRSGLRVSALTLGTMTFGGSGAFQHVGTDRSRGARAASSTSAWTPGSTSSTPPTSTPTGVSEEILGEALEGRRDAAADRHQGALSDGRRAERRGPLAPPPDRRLRGQPAAAAAPITSTSTSCTSGTGRPRSRRRVEALDTLVRQGKVRYVGCSNFSGWHLMKALGDRRAAGRAALRQPADPLHAGGARGRVRARPGRASTRASASSSGARWPAGCSRASTGATSDRPAGSRQLAGWDEPPIRDEDRPVADRRRARGDRRARAASRPRRWRSPGCSPARGSPP